MWISDKIDFTGFPGDLQVKNPPANPGDTVQLLKPARLEPLLHNKRSHPNEKHMHHSKE